jgi:hypothetical protein
MVLLDAARRSSERDADPLREQAAEVFAEQLVVDRVPSIRAIRAQLHVGQPRAQRLRAYLAAQPGGLVNNSPRSGRLVR